MPQGDAWRLHTSSSGNGRSTSIVYIHNADSIQVQMYNLKFIPIFETRLVVHEPNELSVHQRIYETLVRTRNVYEAACKLTKVAAIHCNPFIVSLKCINNHIA